MRRTLLLAVLGFAGLWIAGEHHRSNCIDQGRTSCSVLPWDAGKRQDPLRGFSPQERRAIQREADAIANGR